MYVISLRFSICDTPPPSLPRLSSHSPLRPLLHLGSLATFGLLPCLANASAPQSAPRPKVRQRPCTARERD
ncbi:hypothetical protein L227DRAFT_575313 [Lentinus tigrinus ALCF2SS1-6]|uniref:Uncharacterized protein n=1 Tax=Lentinus tigrinus ALCF2SS1-6 TaxID=1328759 RepID=A0A5C2SFV9_9APHY|nr:hypothetical protein L227DRAFT_575313 [Lentinus tigrinus ALCF2SS1-6]